MTHPPEAAPMTDDLVPCPHCGVAMPGDFGHCVGTENVATCVKERIAQQDATITALKAELAASSRYRKEAADYTRNMQNDWKDQSAKYAERAERAEAELAALKSSATGGEMTEEEHEQLAQDLAKHFDAVDRWEWNQVADFVRSRLTAKPAISPPATEERGK